MELLSGLYSAKPVSQVAHPALSFRVHEDKPVSHQRLTSKPISKSDGIAFCRLLRKPLSKTLNKAKASHETSHEASYRTSHKVSHEARH